MQTQSGAIVSKLLTNVSNAFVPDGFIAETILPPVYVPQTNGKIGKYSNNHLRIVNTVHAGKGPYRQLEAITVSTDTYDIEDHGVHDIITDNDMRNFEQPFDAEVDSTMALTLAHQIGKEYGLASALTDPAVITQGVTLSGNQQYSKISHADSNPIGDSILARQAIRAATGKKPNMVVMNGTVYDYLRFHSQLLDSLGFKYNRPNGLTGEELARALDVERILVGEAMYNASKEGQADDMRFIWPNDVIYLRIDPPAKRQKTLGYEMRKTGTAPRQVYKYNPVMPVNSRGVIVTDNYDQLILNPLCAYLIQDAA